MTKKDESILSDFKLTFEELPLFKRKKTLAKSNKKPSILDDDISNRPSDYIDNLHGSVQPDVLRHGHRLSVRYVSIRGKKVPIFPTRFFHH